MKNIYKLSMALLMVAFLIIGLTGCKDTLPDVPERGTLQLSKSEVIIETSGGSTEVEVVAKNTEWQLLPLPEAEKWIKVEPKGNKIIITVEPSTLSQERTVELVFTAPEAKVHRTLMVRQFGLSPALHVEQEKVVFDRNGGSTTVALTVNGTDWKVSQPVVASWLEIEKDAATKILKLTALPVDKEGEGSGDARSTMLVLSYGTSHHVLNVQQNGWQYFTLPLMKLGATRDEVLAHAAKEQLERNTEYEAGWVRARGDENQTRVLAFTTSALEGPVIAYYFNDYTSLLEKVMIRAAKGQTFNEERLNEWLQSNGYHFAYTGNGQKGTEEYYYAPTENKTTKLCINKSAEYYFRNPDADYRAAVIELSESSNDATLNQRKNGWINLPTRNNSWISNPKYTLNQIIEYEKARGMVLAPGDGETVLNDIAEYSHIKYKKLTFVPEDLSAIGVGQLRKVLYQFNIPGYMDPHNLSRPMEFNSNEPLLAGSIARRFDLYYGGGFFIAYNSWAGRSYVKPDFIQNARAEGYELAMSVDDLGWFYFVNKEEKMVMILQNLESGGVISYGRDEKLFNSLLKELAKKNG